MFDQLRNEITSHIEASGELACWIVPYLKPDAYQVVRKMERDGVIVVKVGKRGEPVYVFAPTPPPADAPTASDDVDARPIEAGDTIRIKGFLSEHVVHSIAENGDILLHNGNTFTTPEYAELVKKADTTPAAAAAQAALRGHTFEKPKAAKLTIGQYDALGKFRGSPIQFIADFNQHTLRALLRRGYVTEIVRPGNVISTRVQITPAGHAALGSEAQ